MPENSNNMNSEEEHYASAMSSQSFAQSSGTQKHKLAISKQYCCKVCGESFARSRHLSVHSRIHAREKNRIFVKLVVNNFVNLQLFLNMNVFIPRDTLVI